MRRYREEEGGGIQQMSEVELGSSGNRKQAEI